MNLDRCTAGQREIITTLDAPLMVAAGAGSGKTFTLTQRIVGALIPHDGHEAELGSIDQVLAITFTRKAAAELKGRIKALLLAEGLREQALAVDGAWVSTIHGMASRILREHALEVGIDPAFEVMPESLSEELRAEAADAVARAVKEDADPLMHELLASKDLLSGGGRGQSLVDLALLILARVEAMPEGFEGLVLARPQCAPGDLMREAYELGCALHDTALAWKSPSATDQKVLDAAEQACQRAQEWLSQSDGRAFDDPLFDVDAFRSALYALPPTSARYRAKKDDADFFVRYRSDLARISREAEASISVRMARPLVRFARMIADEFARLKGPSSLDNADLLMRTARALREHPEIAEEYRNRFKLIMVDEFQDTDKLQVAVISALAQPGLSNVCTVGDAQQSIYRFRGADVNVFFEYRESLKAMNDRARFVNLPDNFRSDGDVLALVDAVFSQQQVFGSEFLHLEPRSVLNAQLDPIFAEYPRVRFDFVHYKGPAQGAKGVSKAEAVSLAARHIAEHFVELRRRGAKAGDMALLLGSMSNARQYADALREQGIESVIAGGSVFSESSEAQLVSALLRYAVNADDEPALFAVLTSELFSLSDDVLLALVSDEEGGAFASRALSKGFRALRGDDAGNLPEDDRQALSFAQEALGEFVSSARRGDVARSLRALLVRTGLLDRLQDAGSIGLAAAGNYEKALCLVRGLQEKAGGIASVSGAYEAHVRCSKEAPGSLSTVDSDYVCIMTVHASKGLEFPHVAIADLGTGVASRQALVVENVGEHTYVGMSLTPAGESKGVVDKLRAYEREDTPCDSPALAGTPGELYDALDAHMRRQTLEEARRLLYVAFTRASRSVYLSHVFKSNPHDLYEKAGIYADLFAALPWDTETDKSVSFAGYGGSAPARITLEYLKAGEEDAPAYEGRVPAGKQTEGHAGELVVPARAVPGPPLAVPCSLGREGVWSYSSLRHQLPDASLLSGVSREEAELVRDEEDDETALGIAFHRIAQRAVLELASARAAGAEGSVLRNPGEPAVRAQICACRLTPDQGERLDVALDRWFASRLAHDVAACTSLDAEVPFMVTLPTPSDSDSSPGCCLEGEIDLLASNGDRHAVIVDYKTGGYSFETEASVRQKHLLQAQCYAYALLISGYDTVEAHFVRVEHADAGDPSQPQVTSYRFDGRDSDALAATIAAARP